MKCEFIFHLYVCCKFNSFHSFLSFSSQNCDQSVDNETVPISENKKPIKIIKINQEMNLDVPENKSRQLIEIDKLLIDTTNGLKRSSSKSGVWHQVSFSYQRNKKVWKKFVEIFLFSLSDRGAKKKLSVNEWMNVAVLVTEFLLREIKVEENLKISHKDFCSKCFKF